MRLLGLIRNEYTYLPTTARDPHDVFTGYKRKLAAAPFHPCLAAFIATAIAQCIKNHLDRFENSSAFTRTSRISAPSGTSASAIDTAASPPCQATIDLTAAVVQDTKTREWNSRANRDEGQTDRRSNVRRDRPVKPATSVSCGTSRRIRGLLLSAKVGEVRLWSGKCDGVDIVPERPISR